MNRQLRCLLAGGMLLSLSGCFALVATGAATGALVAHDRRTTGTIVEDQSIELKAYRTISGLEDDIDDDSHVTVVSYNNNVLLVGQTPNANRKDAIADAVKDIPKIRKIYNEIQIASPTSLMTRSSDTWITTKIKAEMLISRDIDPTRIRVTTEDGVVYLMGIVRPTEEHEAVEIARRTSGVKKVVKMFEYIPDEEADGAEEQES